MLFYTFFDGHCKTKAFYFFSTDTVKPMFFNTFCDGYCKTNTSLSSLSVRVPHFFSKNECVRSGPRIGGRSLIARLPGPGLVIKPLLFEQFSLNSLSVRVPHSLSKNEWVWLGPRIGCSSLVARLPGPGLLIKPMLFERFRLPDLENQCFLFKTLFWTDTVKPMLFYKIFRRTQ